MRLWFERGFRKKPIGYELIKTFSPTAFMGGSSAGKNDPTDQAKNELALLNRFYKKYPEVRYFPAGTQSRMSFGGDYTITHPAAAFIKKQRDLMNKGYTEEKAFQIVEDDIGKFLNQQKEEQRVIRGLALNIHGQSYLDRFQMVAEEESKQKVRRMERDIPKYLRAQEKWMKDLKQLNQQDSAEDQFNVDYERQSVEQILTSENNRAFGKKEPTQAYKPVLYEIVKDHEQAKDKETHGQIQQGFLERTENLMRIFHERSHIHDGLKNLTDEEVLLRVREGPTKLKASAKSLLHKLKKHNVKLDDNGDISCKDLKDQSLIKLIKTNEKLIKLTLMQADLEFEYPQKLERIQVKADILKMLEEEEAKLKTLAQQKQMEEQAKRTLTYEEYYNMNLRSEVETINENSEDMIRASKGHMQYEQFVLNQASKYIFDHDILEKAYKFWENNDEKYERLKKIWIELKRKNALGGIDARTPEEQQEITDQIVELQRKIRFRIDQELTKRNIEPIFKENYRAYDKKEFLIDSDIEFYKIKKLLEKNPALLREDPLLGIDYLKIINLIKRQKIIENTSDHYDPEDQIDAAFINVNEIEKDKLRKKQNEDKMLEEQFKYELGGAGGDDKFNLQELETEREIKTTKKQEEREKQRLLKQFNALAEQFEKSNTMMKKDDKILAKSEAERAQKSTKVKKQKSLGAKLRLKEKKGGGAAKK